MFTGFDLALVRPTNAAQAALLSSRLTLSEAALRSASLSSSERIGSLHPRGERAMARYVSLIPTALVMVALASPASASRVVIPDDLPTIQAGIDSAADTISVRSGLEPERLTVPRFVVIEPASQVGPGLVENWIDAPSIRSMELPRSSNQGVRVLGFRFLGEVRATAMNSGSITFESCRFDSGFTGPDDTGSPYVHSRIRDCMFFGDVSVTGYVTFAGNTVTGATVFIWSDGLHDIQNNYVQGPAECGMRLALQLSLGKVLGNTIRGTNNGILFDTVDGGTTTVKNDIADCDGDGIAYNASVPGNFRCDSNSVVRCGGAGIILRSATGFWRSAGGSGNIVRQCGLGGIDLGGSTVPDARGNTVLDVGGNGFTAGLVDKFEGNVIGRCGGAGVRITEEPWRLVRNSIFSNSGPGMHFSGQAIATNEVSHNISAFNGGPGLLYECVGSPQLSCNDWFGNAGENVVGIRPGETDLFLNPLFCDLGTDDVHLSSDSPLLSPAGCGLIGALGQGCGSTTAVGETPNEFRGFHAWPTPARGPVEFTLPAAASPTVLEVFDVSGARRWQCAVPAGATRLTWDRRETRGPLVVPGVYFARLRREGMEIARVRLVLTK